MTFSERLGFAPADADITTRDAPGELRSAVVSMAYKAGMTPTLLRKTLCETLFLQPDPSNRTEYPNDFKSWIPRAVAQKMLELPWGILMNEDDSARHATDAVNLFCKVNITTVTAIAQSYAAGSLVDFKHEACKVHQVPGDRQSQALFPGEQ